jgi:diguanylate cyclase (GGDEF)-like protein
MADNKDKGSEKTMIITEKDEPAERVTSMEPYLIQISGRETGQMHNLTGRTVKIGRDPAAEIPVDDPHVSRNHAEIVYESPDRIVIRDLGSTNGVFVNGTRISEQALVDGDKVLIGIRVYFKFAFQDGFDQRYQQNLFRAANIDALTQLYNKKYFMDALSKEFSFSRRNKTPMSLLMIDIDYFKKINDTFGHMAGDLVLKHVGQYLLKNLRHENIACRYGGEEFAVVLRNTPGDQAALIGERIRAALETETIDFRGNELRVTISVGAATSLGDDYETIEDFIQAADRNLYEAKAGGRNRTVWKMAA